LDGQQKQHTRLDAVTRFGHMQHAVLFVLDLAVRGFDFPSIDWVVQADAPEDAATYVHRGMVEALKSSSSRFVQARRFASKTNCSALHSKILTSNTSPNERWCHTCDQCTFIMTRQSSKSRGYLSKRLRLR
jgi:ATP-dependent RNA helicase DDX10/DBP4